MKHNPLPECLYYLVREMGGLGSRAKDIYFNDALAHIQEKGFRNLELCELEIRALIHAACRRGRLSELDEAVTADG